MNKNFVAQNFLSEVKSRFEFCNSIFLGLPINENTGKNLKEFKRFLDQNICENSPVNIIDSFFKLKNIDDNKAREDILFDFIKIIERQVVIFDAIEDAAFDKINDLDGANSIKFVIKDYLYRNQKDALTKSLASSKIRLVLTAHPTQFYSGEILGIVNDMEKAIKTENLTEISNLLRQLAFTPFFKRKKPNPYDEAISLVWYLNNVFYDTIINLQQEINALISNKNGEVLNNKLIELGFWPGGDRDGNPFVTSDTTKKVAKKLRESILTKYLLELRGLKRKLTFDGIFEKVTALEKKLIIEIRNLQSKQLTPESFISELEEVRDLLIKNYDKIYLSEINRLICITKIFGFHFASIDIRQDAKVLHQVLHDLLGLNNICGDYSSLNETQKIKFLNSFGHTFTHYGKGLTKDTIKTIESIKNIQANNGENGLHRYIISNCNSVTDVMALYRLFTSSNWGAEKISVDLVPLFETIRSLERCQQTMEELYTNPVYKKHLANRKNKQYIMLGFSDGTKDGGYFSANWSIYKAKEQLSGISKKHNINIVFFDGRGGPAARGGGKTHEFYASNSYRISSNEIQTTVQGQTISSNFGTITSATYNIEQLLSARIKNDLNTQYHADFKKSHRNSMDRLSKTSKQFYLELKNSVKFLPYFTKYTPINYFGDTNISSRPDKRLNKKELNLEDLRAIPFVGSWSMNKQNIPGYYGFGKSLEELIKLKSLKYVQDLYKESKIFKTLVENSQMVLEKSNFEISDFILNDKEFTDVYSTIRSEYKRSIKLLLGISGSKELMGKNPKDKLSIRMREHIILPLVIIQKYALMITNNKLLNEKHKDIYQKMVIRCSYGIINAGRNSA